MVPKINARNYITSNYHIELLIYENILCGDLRQGSIFANINAN